MATATRETRRYLVGFAKGYLDRWTEKGWQVDMELLRLLKLRAIQEAMDNIKEDPGRLVNLGVTLAVGAVALEGCTTLIVPAQTTGNGEGNIQQPDLAATGEAFALRQAVEAKLAEEGVVGAKVVQISEALPFEDRANTSIDTWRVSLNQLADGNYIYSANFFDQKEVVDVVPFVMVKDELTGTGLVYGLKTVEENGKHYLELDETQILGTFILKDNDVQDLEIDKDGQKLPVDPGIFREVGSAAGGLVFSVLKPSLEVTPVPTTPATVEVTPTGQVTITPEPTATAEVIPAEVRPYNVNGVELQPQKVNGEWVWMNSKGETILTWDAEIQKVMVYSQTKDGTMIFRMEADSGYYQDVSGWSDEFARRAIDSWGVATKVDVSSLKGFDISVGGTFDPTGKELGVDYTEIILGNDEKQFFLKPEIINNYLIIRCYPAPYIVSDKFLAGLYDHPNNNPPGRTDFLVRFTLGGSQLGYLPSPSLSSSSIPIMQTDIKGLRLQRISIK